MGGVERVMSGRLRDHLSIGSRSALSELAGLANDSSGIIMLEMSFFQEDTTIH